MYLPREQLLLDYEGLPDGVSVAGELCPACSGGRTGERTLSVSRTGGSLVWTCHRASCGFRGRSNVSGSGSYPYTKPAQCRGVVGCTILRNSETIPEYARELLTNDYSLTEQAISKHELSWDTDTNRLCLPVKNARGETLGVNLRSLSGDQPKSKLHAEEGAIAWYVNHATTRVIIVEDQLSAIRASDYLTSVALLGTNLNDERYYEIRKQAKSSPIYLALDADAWDKAVKLSIKYRLRLLKLTKDIKNMSEQELKEWVDESICN